MLFLSAVFLLATTGCGGGASIEEMVAGGGRGRGDLGCWLTMKFDKLPDGDPSDVVVRFHSEALSDMPEFDWKYRASHDVIQQESGWAALKIRRRHPTSPRSSGK